MALSSNTVAVACRTPGLWVRCLNSDLDTRRLVLKLLLKLGIKMEDDTERASRSSMSYSPSSNRACDFGKTVTPFPPLTRRWNIEDSESDTSQPNSPTTRPNLDTRGRLRHKHKGRDGEPGRGSREVAIATGVNDRLNTVDAVPPLSTPQPEPPSPHWSQSKVLIAIGRLAVTFSLIFVFSRLGRFSWSKYASESALLPPRNILLSRNDTVAKFDLSDLALVCKDSDFPICATFDLVRSLDPKVSQNKRDIESLGCHLGALLYPIKVATKREECSYFPQLQLEINQAWKRTFKIQGSLNDALGLLDQVLSHVSRSRLIAEQMKASANKDADGSLRNMGGTAKRERKYTESSKWLDLLEDYSQKLKSEEVLWRWELERQNRLQSDLLEVEKQIEELRIQQSKNEIRAGPLCTAFNMQRVERRLIDTMMRATEDEAAAQRLGNYYRAL